MCYLYINGEYRLGHKPIIFRPSYYTNRPFPRFISLLYRQLMWPLFQKYFLLVGDVFWANNQTRLALNYIVVEPCIYQFSIYLSCRAKMYLYVILICKQKMLPLVYGLGSNVRTMLQKIFCNSTNGLEDQRSKHDMDGID